MKTTIFEQPVTMRPDQIRASHILVVDDEADLCEILQFNLESEGFNVDTAYSAEEALELPLEKYDLILLDVMMGEISGFKLANILKKDERLKNIPVIFVTAKSTENDTLTGFNLGAEDYISKPFSVKEVIARVKVTLRHLKNRPENKTSVINIGDLKIFPEEKKLVIDGRTINLTKKEFEILLLLCQHPGKVFTREKILTQIWEHESYILDRTVDVNITRLRKKIGSHSKKIVTRQGYGYCFEQDR
ncbi:DNA-binding response regulator [Prolixibacter bellariivorans]|uniref:DNA-binding response regulator n=1 Tax=Prolixibacter bellariivorans TaxID=314319 RepID=A0A5M4AWI4_9BACT|nr:response regulator transcription factor [Prolixibacter bellariivorans]GET31807.1 DNA-binding response regulator [Prolixibacter bellariivorans]